MSAKLSPQTLRAVARCATAAGRRVRFAMRGCSMLPLLHEPMVLEIAAPVGRCKVGDVIVFAAGDIHVAHRVIGFDGEQYVASGDAQPLVTEHVAPADVLGRVESIWENGSAMARRVDAGRYRWRGFWYARAHPARRFAARTRAFAGRAIRRAMRLAQRHSPNI